MGGWGWAATSSASPKTERGGVQWMEPQNTHSIHIYLPKAFRVGLISMCFHVFGVDLESIWSWHVSIIVASPSWEKQHGFGPDDSDFWFQKLLEFSNQVSGSWEGLFQISWWIIMKYHQYSSIMTVLTLAESCFSQLGLSCSTDSRTNSWIEVFRIVTANDEWCHYMSW